jgi:hypothetical protein
VDDPASDRIELDRPPHQRADVAEQQQFEQGRGIIEV